MLTKIEFVNIDIEPIKFINGVNIILGNKESTAHSNNSVGKTLLINIIDHLLGANDSKKFYFKELIDVSVIGHFLFGGKLITVKRDLNKSVNTLEILSNELPDFENKSSISLKEWTRFLGNIYVNSNIMSFRNYNSMFFRTVDMEDFNIAIKAFPSNNAWEKAVYNSYFLNFKNDVFKESKHYNSKEKAVIKSIAPTIKKVLTVDKDIEVSIDNLQKQYTEISIKIMNIHKFNRQITTKLELLNKNLEELEQYESSEFNELFNVFEAEMKKFFIKNFEETKEFHNKLINDNKDMILSEKEKLTRNLEQNNKKLIPLLENKKELKNMLSEFDQANKNYVVNQLLTEVLGETNIDDLIKKADKEIEDESRNRQEEYLKSIAPLIDKYRKEYARSVNFIYSDIKEDEVDFDIFVSKNGYLDIKINYKGVNGEGKGTVRTLIYIYLLLYIQVNRNMDYLIFDSKVIDAVDVDDLDRYLKLLDDFGKKRGIQIICAGNKQNFVTNNKYYNAITLSPDKNLFRMDLTEIK